MNKTKNSINQTNAKGYDFIMSDEEQWLSPQKRKRTKMCAPLSYEEEQSLAIKIQQGDEKALVELYMKNVPLAYHIAEDFFSNVFDNEEIFAVARMGLLNSCKLFEASKNRRLSSYASKAIKRHIKRYIATGARIVNTSSNTYPIFCKFLRQRRELENELDREPTTEELIEKTGLKKHKITQFMFIVNYTNPSTIENENYYEDENHTGTRAEILQAETLSPIEEICEKEKLQEIRRCLYERFKDEPRTLEILTRRFGFNGTNQIDTLEEISKDLGITRERVRQLEEIALNTLRKYLQEQQINN